MSWPDHLEVPPVFISQLKLSPATVSTIIPGIREDTHLYLFGFRINFSEALIVPEALSRGYFIEYGIIAYRANGSFTEHHLKQWESVTYTESPERKDYINATEIDPEQVQYIAQLPQWKETEANWPLWAGVPMAFIGQVFLPENQVTRTYLAWDKFVYIFAAEKNGLIFKISTQDADLQTVEEHYAEEEREGAKKTLRKKSKKE